ncbi:MAG: nitroreductase family protein [Actinomycetota bacterium]|nr:nitroreductase family protein [Actinomycetota bacterium]
MSPPVVHPLLAGRWSAKEYDPSRSVTADQLTRLLEAARWAPSSGNSQPWRFVVAGRHEPVFARLLATLSPSNRAWAQHAAALILVAAETLDQQGRRRRFAAYDVGRAVAQLTVQAQAEGLGVCQMGGFDASAAATEFSLDPGLEPLVVLAVGPAAVTQIPARLRKPLEDLLLPTPREDNLLSA